MININGDAIMNIAVPVSLRFAETCLICHKGDFKRLHPLFTELSHFISFSSMFLLLNDLFIFIKICSICLVLKTR